MSFIPLLAFFDAGRGIAIAISVTVAVSSFSCGGDSPSLGSGELLEADTWPYRSQVTLPVGQDENVPGYMTVSAITVKGLHALDEPITIDQDCRLEYTPFIAGAGAGAKLKTLARVDGADTLLTIDEPVSVDDMEHNYQRLVGLPRTRVDLSRFRGQTIRLKWTVESADPEVQVRLMDLRISPITKARPPDILIVCSDTHRFDYSLSEHGKTLMPQLTEFASGATTYTAAYAPASWTLPSISSVYTGRWPRFHQTGAPVRSVEPAQFDRSQIKEGQFFIEFPERTRIMTTFLRSMPTIQNRLREYGYKTVLVNANSLYVLAGLSTAGFSTALTFGNAPGERLNSLAADYIRETPADEPLFLVVHYMYVHEFGLVPDEVLSNRVNGRSPTDSDNVNQMREKYAYTVKLTDRNFGELLSTWKANRPLENSVVLFYSDHGEHLHEPDEIFNQTASYHGTTMDDALLHVPLVVSYPEQARAGEVISDAVSLVDIPRTILDLIGGTDASGTFQGNLLYGEKPDGERKFFADYQFIGDSLGSVRLGSRKLVLNLENGKAYELDCASQPCRLVNEWDGAAQDENTMHAAYWSHASAGEQFNVSGSDRHAVDAEEALKHLKTLGYVE